MNKPVKILYTIPNFDTCGSSMALFKLVSGLDKTEFEPHIVCLHNKGVLFERVRLSGIPLHIFPYLTPMKPYLKSISGILKFSRFIKKNKFDIIFSYHYGSDYSEALSAKLAGKKFVYVKKNMSWKGSSYNGWKMKTMLADAITVQNTDMMNAFFNNMKKAKLLSIGVDTNEYYKRKKEENLLQELNIKPNDKIVLCVANIIPQKGIQYLLDGFSLLNQKYKDITLIIVGDYENELGRQMLEKASGISSDKIIFTGKRKDVSGFLTIADIFIMPSSVGEGSPVAVQEAMASSVLVIGTNVSGIKDQLSEFPEQLIEPKSAEAISKAIEKFLYINPEIKNNIISKQLQVINDRYSLTSEIKQHRKLYSELMGL